jgi:hypothetical protein
MKSRTAPRKSSEKRTVSAQDADRAARFKRRQKLHAIYGTTSGRKQGEAA